MYVLWTEFYAKLLLLLWVQTVRPLSQINCCTAMRKGFMLSLQPDTQYDIIEAIKIRI